EHGRGLADRADAPVEVLEGDVALRRPVHLDDAGYAEPLLERDPDVGSESRAGGDADAMLAVARRRGLAEEVAAHLADVHEGDGLVAPHVVQEGARAEAPPRGEGAARTERGGEADEEALAVVERKRRVDRLAGLDPEQRGEADAAHREAEMPDDGGLRIAGRPRRVDVEEHVAAAQL